MKLNPMHHIHQEAVDKGPYEIEVDPSFILSYSGPRASWIEWPGSVLILMQPSWLRTCRTCTSSTWSGQSLDQR